MSETSTSESLPEWQANKDVQHLAEAILQEKRFQDLPILADALFDAGFSDEGALQSLRNPEYQDHFQYWTAFYQTYFKDINILDVLAVRFPERTKEQKELGFDLPIVIPKGLTLNRPLKPSKMRAPSQTQKLPSRSRNLESTATSRTWTKTLPKTTVIQVTPTKAAMRFG